MLIIALTSKTMQPSALYDAADTVVAQRIAQVDGVADVNVSGAEQPAIRVRVNPGAVAAAGISLETVRTAIVNANSAGPLGAFDGEERAETIATNDQLREAPDYRDIVIRASNGNVVRLSDIATIEQGTRNSRSAAWFNQQPAVLLIITKQGDANVIDTVDRIKELLPELQRWIPAGIDISILSDRTGTIRASVHDMQLTLLATIALVMLVVFVFLRRVPATLAAGVTVPLSLAGTCAADVAGRLFDRQHLADGARRLGRLRRGRRHRHDREHVPQSRARPLAAASRDRRRAADRLHGHLHQPFARLPRSFRCCSWAGWSGGCSANSRSRWLSQS